MRLLANVAVGVARCALAQPAGAVEVKYLYRLSNFSGVIPYSDVEMCADPAHDEIYVGEGDLIRVFNASGMEIYDFSHDAMSYGAILDIGVMPSGDILVLSYRQPTEARAGGSQVTRYNYRGEPLGSFEVHGLPSELAGFTPNRLAIRQDSLVFASTASLLVVTTDFEGTYRRHVDLLATLPKNDKAREGAELGGFYVDDQGAILYTIPTAFRAFRLKPDGTADSWGKPGSGPGSFSVVGAILAAPNGYTLVADRARGAVLVFDPSLRFVREFGNRGPIVEQLNRPGLMVFGRDGKLYVSQLGYHGLSVFALTTP